MGRPNRRTVVYLIVLALLAGALVWGLVNSGDC